jgi:hypothetical protein
MKSTGVFSLAFAVCVLSSAFDNALCQTTRDMDREINAWADQKGVVVTKTARDELGQALVGFVKINAPAVGFGASEINSLERSARESSMTLQDSTSPIARYVVVSPNASTVPVNAFQTQFVFALFGLVTPTLERFPNIRLVVQPVPPRDYTVHINGQRYEATERGLYGVAPGRVGVRVIRETKPPCAWEGMVLRDSEQLVSCNF